MSLTGGSDEVAEFLRNYTLPPKALHKLYHLQVSSEAFTQQPAEILRLLGFMNELEIHNIASDWREYSSTGYSPSYIDRLLDEFNQPNVLADPSDDLTISFSASLLDIPESIAEDIPTETTVVSTKSVSFAPSPIVEKAKPPKAESSPSSSSTTTKPILTNPPAPASTSAVPVATPVPTATKPLEAKEKPDLTDIIRELRALVDQRTVENDYLRLQNNSHVEDVERRAREYKELRDECNQWKKTARETESKLRQAESLHQVTLAELEEAQRAIGKKHAQLMRVQEDLQEQHLLSSDLEQELFSLRQVMARRKGVDAEIQSDAAMLRKTWTLVTGESISMEPVERAPVDMVIAVESAIEMLQVSHINEEDDRLMSGDVRDEAVGSDDGDIDVERGIVVEQGVDDQQEDEVVSTRSTPVVETTDSGVNTDPAVQFDAETDTHDLHGEEDFVPTSSRITVSKKPGKVVQDPWPNLSYAQLLDKYRTLEEESTAWQKKQYQELIDAQSEVRRLEVVLVEQHEEAQSYKERYEKLLVSSISEINETVMQEKAESAEAIATLQQQREGYLAKIAHLQETLAQREAVIEEKDREIQRLRRQWPGSSYGEAPISSSRLPPNLTEGRAIDVSKANTSVTVVAVEDGGIETWSRERVKDKLAHEDMHEKHRWEEKEKLYLMNMDHLSASLKELTAVFHQQQEQLHQLLPPIHPDLGGATVDPRNGTEFEPKATSFSDPGAGALASRVRPVPPSSNNGISAQPVRPKTSHGPIISTGPAPATALSSSEGTAGNAQMKGKAFQHRHRALKAAVKTTTNAASPPRLMVVDDNGSPVRVEQPDALYYVDDDGSDDGHVMFAEHDQHSPTTLTDHERKQLEKEHKDRLLAKAYDPESLRRIYFHPANKVPPRPSTGGATTKATRPSSMGNHRPSSSSGYKHPSQKNGKKHDKARPRSSLVANFIQGLELRYHEDLARMIQAQQEQDGPFFEHLAQAVGQPQPQPPSTAPRTTAFAVPQQSQPVQQQSTRPVDGAVPYPENQYHQQHLQQHHSKNRPHKGPQNTTTAAAAAAVVSDMDGEGDRGHRGGGFFITVVPSSSTDPAARKSPRVVPQLPPTTVGAARTEPGTAPTAFYPKQDQRRQQQPQPIYQPTVGDNEGNPRKVEKSTKPKKQPPSNREVSPPPMANVGQPQQPEAEVLMTTPPRRHSRGGSDLVHHHHHHHQHQHHRHAQDGDVPLTSYPMMNPQHSISSVGSSSGHSSMAPSQFSSPSMVLHPSNSQPADAFLFLHQDSLLQQDSLQQLSWKDSSMDNPQQQLQPQPQPQPQPQQQAPEIVFHRGHRINRSSSASY